VQEVKARSEPPKEENVSHTTVRLLLLAMLSWSQSVATMAQQDPHDDPNKVAAFICRFFIDSGKYTVCHYYETSGTLDLLEKVDIYGGGHEVVLELKLLEWPAEGGPLGQVSVLCSDRSTPCIKYLHRNRNSEIVQSLRPRYNLGEFDSDGSRVYKAISRLIELSGGTKHGDDIY